MAAPPPVQVLLVDDQPLVAAAVRRLLAGAPDLELCYCRDAAEAEAALPGAGVVLLDLHMPGQGGLQVLRSLRARPEGAALPVVVLSSREDPETKAEALTAGADDYLVKLPAAVELVARLRALLRRCDRRGAS